MRLLFVPAFLCPHGGNETYVGSLVRVALEAGHEVTVVSPRPALAANNRAPVYFDTTGFWLQGSFREYWETHGGLFIFGYPITGVFMDNGLWKQYFERAIFEWHPESDDLWKVQLRRLGAKALATALTPHPPLPMLGEGE